MKLLAVLASALQIAAARASCTAQLSGGGTETFDNCYTVQGTVQVHLFWSLDDASAAKPLVHFLAQASQTAAAGYLSVGFGNSAGQMVPASVAVALANHSTPVVHDYRLTGVGDPNTGDGKMELSATSATAADGTVTLRFSRPLKCAASDVEAIEPTAKTNIVVATKSTAGWGYHDFRAAISISLASGKATPTSEFPWKSIHAYSMMFTWGVVAPAAIMITRFGRFANQESGGPKGALTPVAYRWHLYLQIFVAVSTACGCAIGLFAIGGGGWSTHKILGILITGIVIVQFCLGLCCRPSPSSSARWCWNMCHHWLGRTALICAWLNFLYGLRLFSPLVDGANSNATYVDWILAFGPPVLATIGFLSFEYINLCCGEVTNFWEGKSYESSDLRGSLNQTVEAPTVQAGPSSYPYSVGGTYLGDMGGSQGSYARSSYPYSNAATSGGYPYR